MSVVESDMQILGGVLVFKSTRVTVHSLFDYLVAGQTVSEFLEDFPTVSFDQVKHVIKSAEVAYEKTAA